MMKNFKIEGIGSKVQIGETGLILKTDGTVFMFRNLADNAYVRIKALNPTQFEDVVTLQYLLNSLPSIPVSSKGDIFTHDGSASAKIGVGANGQVLKANSSTLTGLEWANESGGYVSPVNTKGDIFIASNGGVDNRLPVGANDFILVPDSTTNEGLKWVSLASHPTIIGINSDITVIENDILGINVVLNDHETRIDNLEAVTVPVVAKGDLYTHNGTSATKLSIGANNQVLVADNTQPTGMKWATPSGGGSGALKEIILGTSSGNFTQTLAGPITVNNSYVDVVSDGSPIEYTLMKDNFSAETYIGCKRTDVAGRSAMYIALYYQLNLGADTVVANGISIERYTEVNRYWKDSPSIVSFYWPNPPVGNLKLNIKTTIVLGNELKVQYCTPIVRVYNV